MRSIIKKWPILQDRTLGISRGVTLLGSILVALGSGTNYIYSSYAPQLGARLRISHTQLNLIGLAGNMGVNMLGPVWGRITDRKGPRIPLTGALICNLIGYLGIKQMYDNGIGQNSAVSAFHLALLVTFGFISGAGGNAGLSPAMNTSAKSFPPSSRATVTGLVVSGYGLSAFWFTLLANSLFPGDTSAFLLVLALGTAILMLIGLVTVKLVPLPLTSSGAHDRPAASDYDPVLSEDAIVFVGEPQATIGSESDDFQPLLSHAQPPTSHQVPPSPVELSPPSDLHREECIEDKYALPNIHGKQLWLTPDFYLVFVIMAICGGTGIMYINNVGSISRALYVETHPVYDDIEASKWQAAQVSILSLGNFSGRILTGLISDYTHTRLHIPRAYYLCIISLLFIISQATAIAVSSVETLWIATLFLGLAYGSLFGSYPSIMIEWFGMAHFSENWGFISLSGVIGGNLLSVMFGRNLDAHVSSPESDWRSSSVTTRTWSWITSKPRELPSEYHQCLDGKMCYVESLQVTLVACFVSLGLSWWAGIRDKQKLKNRNCPI